MKATHEGVSGLAAIRKSALHLLRSPVTSSKRWMYSVPSSLPMLFATMRTAGWQQSMVIFGAFTQKTSVSHCTIFSRRLLRHGHCGGMPFQWTRIHSVGLRHYYDNQYYNNHLHNNDDHNHSGWVADPGVQRVWSKLSVAVSGCHKSCSNSSAGRCASGKLLMHASESVCWYARMKAYASRALEN